LNGVWQQGRHRCPKTARVRQRRAVLSREEQTEVKGRWEEGGWRGASDSGPEDFEP
jgi:hypothetical protein